MEFLCVLGWFVLDLFSSPTKETHCLFLFGSSTVDLLKQLSYRCCNDEVMMGVAFDEVCYSLPIIFVMYDSPFKALFDIFVR